MNPIFFRGLFAVCLLASTHASAQTLKAGAAKVSITPPNEVFPYAALHENPYVGVHDLIFARALVLDDGRKRIVLVSLEVTQVPFPESLLKALSAIANVPESNIILAASHTHNVPLVSYHGGEANDKERTEIERLRVGATAAVREAISRLQPAHLSTAHGEAFVNINNGEANGMASGHDPAGSSDHRLDVIRVVSSEGAPIGMVLSYANHGEVMFRSVTKDGGYEVSGDLPGAVSTILEQVIEGAPVTLFMPGAEGDQHVLSRSLEPKGLLPARDAGAAGWALLDAQARHVAEAALVALDKPVQAKGEIKIGVATGTATCPGQRMRLDRETNRISIEEQPPVNIQLSVVTLDELAITGIGGDLGSAIGLAIRKKLPTQQTLLVTMIAGSVGYILPSASYAKPGHGVLGSPLKPGCAEHAIPDGLAKLYRNATKQ